MAASVRLLGRKFVCAVGAKSGSLWVALPPPAHHSDGAVW